MSNVESSLVLSREFKPNTAGLGMKHSEYAVRKDPKGWAKLLVMLTKPTYLLVWAAATRFLLSGRGHDMINKLCGRAQWLGTWEQRLLVNRSGEQ
jgi:hypothetical protein